MKILLNSTKLKKELKKIQSLGHVPTMGSIHKGHEFLILRSLKECKKTIVSIFVNPTQFNNKDDFKSYPNNIKKDLNILRKLKVDFVFIPKINDIYKFKRKRKIKLKKKDIILCAKFRKGHFEGVLDVMDRLTNMINPKKIYMGQKDYQQYYLVKKFLEKKYSTQIIKCKTIRNNQSVALSSRNIKLTTDSLFKTSMLIKNLKKIKKTLSKSINIDRYLKKKSVELMQKYGIKIEYLEFRNLKDLKKSDTKKNSKIFIAFYIDEVRLIDNL